MNDNSLFCNDELISVIIPVYNVLPYLPRCINSVINQTYKNLQILLIDDGSTDGSSAICDDFALIDNRISVIHKPNGGLSSARNVGLDNASGQWVVFLDSDDWIAPSMYETLHSIAIQKDARVCSCNTSFCYSDYIPTPQKASGQIYDFNIKEIIEGLVSQQYIRFEVWNKLWRRDIIGDIRFIDGQVSEDVYFDRCLFMKEKRIVYIDKYLHYYTVSRPGNTKSFYRKARNCVFHEFELWSEELNSIGESESALTISYISALFAIEQHCSACESNQDISEKRFLRSCFMHSFKNLSGSKYCYRKGIVVFLFSPFIYRMILRIKRVLNSLFKD